MTIGLRRSFLCLRTGCDGACWQPLPSLLPATCLLLLLLGLRGARARRRLRIPN